MTISCVNRSRNLLLGEACGHAPWYPCLMFGVCIYLKVYIYIYIYTYTHTYVQCIHIYIYMAQTRLSLYLLEAPVDKNNNVDLATGGAQGAPNKL